MRNRWRGRRPSPAIVVGVVALIVALAGTAVAGVSVLDNREKKQVRKIARKQADARITKRAPNLSVGSAENATNAADAAAVGGQTVQTLNVLIAANQSNPNVLNIGGLQLGGDCNGADLNLDGHNSSGQSAQLFVEGSTNDGDHFLEDDDFAERDNAAIMPDDISSAQVTASVLLADGTITTALLTASNSNNDPSGCRIWGRVLSG